MENLKITTPIPSNDFRRLLRDELVARCKKNPRYSLRAFAKSLGIYHATLSAIISGRRSITKKTILALAPQLSLNADQIDLFATFKEEDVNEFEFRETYRQLEMDAFIVTSEWYYDGILELTHVKGFQGNAKWISKRLGVSVNEISAAIERLERLDMLKKLSSGKWIDTSRDTTTIPQTEHSNAALRRYQEKMLELSSISLGEVPIEKRSHTSMTVAIRLNDLEEVKKKIRAFRRNLTKYLQRTGVVPEEVYSLNISFFPNSIPEDPS